MFGFPVAANQFRVLSPAESQSQLQREEGLVDPRSTRLFRLAAQRAEDRGTMADGGIPATVTLDRDAQGTFASGDCVDPVVSEFRSQFFSHFLSAYPPDILELQSGGNVQYLLGTGAIFDDALYYHNVNDVACMDGPCNKRISVAGPERSAGRPGHTPIRRELACGKTIEDSCAGQDWSAGRPGNRPFGASSAACPSPITACLGPYGTASRQPHHTGPNTREETFTVTSSTGRPRGQSTSQLATRSSQRPSAAEPSAFRGLQIARHRRRWLCTRVGRLIFIEDKTRMSTYGRPSSVAG